MDATPEALKAYRALGRLPIFQVDVAPALPQRAGRSQGVTRGFT